MLLKDCIIQCSAFPCSCVFIVSFLLPFFLGIRVGDDISVLQVHPHNYGKIGEELLAYFPADIFMPEAHLLY